MYFDEFLWKKNSISLVFAEVKNTSGLHSSDADVNEHCNRITC